MEGSLQFDPAPRAGEPLVSRRVPDYFLVSMGGVRCGACAYGLHSDDNGRRMWFMVYMIRALCILHRIDHMSSIPGQSG